MKYLINNVTTDWHAFIEQQFALPYLQKIDNLLERTQSVILPEKQLIFAAFNYFNTQQTNVVLIGQDPYPNALNANGLAFSSNADRPIPASLRNIFKELANDLGIMRTNPDLSDWAKQGILLLNTTLTVYENLPSSHSRWGWEQLLINTIIFLNENAQHVVFVLLGKHAQQLRPYIDHTKHCVICRSHPSPLAVNQVNHHFFNTHLFTEINEYLLQKKAITIKW